MNYIDFHVHAFSDKIAEKTVAMLAATCGETPETNGTLAATEAVMQKWGIDGMAVLSIATKPSQHLVCNNWAASIKAPHIFPFGSVHPDGEDVMQELERIRELGLYGIKLHPDYQNFCIEEERMYPIYRKCGELGLPIVFHAGFDPLSPDFVHCTPQGAAKALAAAPETTMILAHMGGNEMWDEVEEVLCGRFPNLYLDTSLCAKYMTDEQCLRIIRGQGADKILLASDCPWDNTANTIAKIKGLGLTEEEQRMIFSENAKKILHLND
ncbi:MAG: amidohydrolase family protein [Oscillospiraceae bacterium]|nr:amidohydrolase family protein [Oscillospiraceae bacterium]